MKPLPFRGAASALSCALAVAPSAFAQSATPAASAATPAAAAAPAPAAPAAPEPAPAAAASPEPEPAPAPTHRAPALAPEPQFELAPAPAPLPDVPVATEHAAPVTPAIELWLGFHDQIIASESLDTFSEDDQVPAFHVGAGLGLSDFDSGQLALVASGDFGGTSASVRGQPSELTMIRIGLGPELRFPLLERAYVYGRVSPQALHVSTELTESNSGLRLSREQWTFALDAAIGASLRVAALQPKGAPHPLGLFVRLEAGYFWSPSLDLTLSPEGGAPVRTTALDLGELALRGMTFGAGVGVGY
jgi:hypothetical protein